MFLADAYVADLDDPSAWPYELQGLHECRRNARNFQDNVRAVAVGQRVHLPHPISGLRMLFHIYDLFSPEPPGEIDTLPYPLDYYNPSPHIPTDRCRVETEAAGTLDQEAVTG